MTRRFRSTAILAGALALAPACLSHEVALQPTADASTLSNELDWDMIRLGPNDVVRVGVYDHPELSSLPHATTAAGTRIDAEGNLSLPLVGAVQVAGMKVSEATEAITAAFSEYLNEPRVDVSVIEYAARRFYLFGEVQSPGAIVLDRPLNLYQALALGGGFTPRADRDQVILLRGEAEELEVFVFDGAEPSADGLLALRPDDLLFVRRNGAGEFSQEILPYLQGASASLSSIATLILIGNEIDD